MDLSGDSTVEYCGSSMEYKSDGSSVYPSSVMSSSAWDGDDSDGSSVDCSVTEEVMEMEMIGTMTGEDYSADELLDRYNFSPPGGGGRPSMDSHIGFLNLHYLRSIFAIFQLRWKQFSRYWVMC